jgi:competence protein ComEC
MIGIVTGILPVAQMPSLPSMTVVPVMLLASVLILAVSASISSSRGAYFVSGLLLGAALGIFHGQSLLDRRVVTECELAVVRLEGTVSSLPRVSAVRLGELRQTFEFQLSAIEPQHCAGPRKVLLSYYGEQTIVPGEQWRFYSRLKRPWGVASPGAFNMQAWYAQAGLDAVGSVRKQGAERLSAAGGIKYAHHRARQTISKHLADLPLSPDAISVLRAITVADKSGMEKQLWNLFQQFGINHLLVISGLHIGLVAGLGLLLGNGLGRLALLGGNYHAGAYLPGILALLLAGCYAALAGFSLSTNRALIMLSSFVLASLMGRSSGSWNNLLLAACLVLLLNPLAALGSGFWLSFGAVAWLLWLGVWQRGAGWAKRLLYTHFCMSLLMIPLGGYWFGGASLVAGLSNLVMVPLVGFFIVPLALLGVALQGFMPALGDTILIIAAWPLEKLIPAATAVAGGEGTRLFWQFTPSLVAIPLALLGLSVLVASRNRWSVTIAVLLSVPLLLPRGRSWSDNEYLAKLTVLDVGQGSAIVLQGPERTLVFDTGGGDPQGSNMSTNVVLPYLRQEGISALDTLLVSHADNDHSAGTSALLSALPVDQYLYGGEPTSDAPGQPCRAGQAWRWNSSISFQVLSPAGEQGLSSNNSSCVLQVEIGQLNLMLPGDIDGKRERELVRYWRSGLDSEWLLAAHHGSRFSSSRLWLKYVQPSRVVFSSGYGNAFGHPHPLIVELTASGSGGNHFTSSGGSLEFYIDAAGELEIDRYRLQHKRYWF